MRRTGKIYFNTEKAMYRATGVIIGIVLVLLFMQIPILKNKALNYNIKNHIKSFI